MANRVEDSCAAIWLSARSSGISAALDTPGDCLNSPSASLVRSSASISQVSNAANSAVGFFAAAAGGAKMPKSCSPASGAGADAGAA